MIITMIELAVGIFDNIIMHWNVWDYSNMPFNFLGQICIPFSAFWFVLCIPARLICKHISALFCNKKAVPIVSEQPM